MLQELKWIWRHPPAAGRGLNRLYYTQGGRVKENQNGTRLFDIDWDICAILDACRYDFYKSYSDESDLLGRVERRTSVGSSTPEFIKVNFKDQTYPDTVYVTANPQFYFHRDLTGPTFHACLNIWQEQWDEDLQTVPPEKMSEAVRRVAVEYPQKRILAHYVQPHVPFIGQFGRQTFPISLTEGDGESWSAARKFWPSVRQGKRDTSREHLRKAYLENLEVALESVIPTLSSLNGKSIITSDHGQLLGERIKPIPIREYGHPAGLYVDELVSTPLHKLPFESRREIKRGTLANEVNRPGDSVVEDRLNALGYTG